MSREKNTSNGIGLGTVLFLIFLTLKLAEVGPVQYWSWWWVTSPLWIPLSLVLVVLAIAGFIVWIGHTLNK
jgi:hypothetical protein